MSQGPSRGIFFFLHSTAATVLFTPDFFFLTFSFFSPALRNLTQIALLVLMYSIFTVMARSSLPLKHGNTLQRADADPGSRIVQSQRSLSCTHLQTVPLGESCLISPSLDFFLGKIGITLHCGEA